MGYVKSLRAVIGTMPVNLVATTVIVINGKGDILLQKRCEPYGVWGLPGGQIELGESTENAGKREVLEETGLIIDDLHLIDVFSGNESSYIKLKNGDEYYVVLIAYYTRNFKGILKSDKIETLECSFFNINSMPDNILERHKSVIKRYFEIVEPNSKHS